MIVEKYASFRLGNSVCKFCAIVSRSAWLGSSLIGNVPLGLSKLFTQAATTWFELSPAWGRRKSVIVDHVPKLISAHCDATMASCAPLITTMCGFREGSGTASETN